MLSTKMLAASEKVTHQKRMKILKMLSALISSRDFARKAKNVFIPMI